VNFLKLWQTKSLTKNASVDAIELAEAKWRAMLRGKVIANAGIF